MIEIFPSFVVNAKANLRRVTLNGRKYLVAPGTMLVEGVHEGSQGPVLYTADLLSKSPDGWNKMPLVNNHPTRGGQFVAVGGDQGVVAQFGMGHIDESAWDKALTTNMYFDEEMTRKINRQALFMLNQGRPFEVSTGMGATIDWKQTGEWNGVKYKGVVTEITPDHLAVLTNSVGACSVKAGCGGFVVNEKSFARIYHGLMVALEAQKGYRYSVRDVYSDYFVFSDGNGDLFKMEYTVNSDGTLTLGGEAEAVRWVTEYRTEEGIFVGNCTCSTLKGTDDMNKAQMIDALIANGTFAADDRAWLEKKSDADVAKYHAMSTPKPPTPAPTPTPTPTPTPAPQVANVDWRTLLPANVVQMVDEGLAIRQRDLDRLVANILAHPKAKENPSLTKEYLDTLPPGTLHAWSQMLGPVGDGTTPTVANAGATPAPPVYGGQGAGQATQAQQPPAITPPTNPPVAPDIYNRKKAATN